MTSTAADHSRWRSPALGPPRILDLPGGRRLAYHDVGSGPPIVFVHGLLVNANLWRKLVERLSGKARCVVLDLPLGAHDLPLPSGTEHGPPMVADMVADALETLDLDDVTLVGSDTGGAICQIVVTSRPERIGRLVLASCDYRDNFPPKLFSYLKPAAAVPGLMWALLQPLRLRLARRSPIAFGWLTKRPIDRAAEDSYLLPAIRDASVRDDARAFIRASDVAQTNAAADRLGDFTRPALIAWSADDRVFPLADAHSLAADLPNSSLALVEDAYTFSMEDNPDQLATLIADFVHEAPSGS
ncbi:MAG: alpha/beta hydrolase [Thermoleophilaceae bacterium]